MEYAYKNIKLFKIYRLFLYFYSNKMYDLFYFRIDLTDWQCCPFTVKIISHLVKCWINLVNQKKRLDFLLNNCKI